MVALEWVFGMGIGMEFRRSGGATGMDNSAYLFRPFSLDIVVRQSSQYFRSIFNSFQQSTAQLLLVSLLSYPLGEDPRACLGKGCASRFLLTSIFCGLSF